MTAPATPRASAADAPAARLLHVDENSAGQRLDNFLMRELKGAPKTLVYRIIRSGEVRVNKGRAGADTRVADGDVVRVFNERGVVLAGVMVTERIIPGAVSIDHGAKIDLVMLKNQIVDRGGCINLIAPAPTEKYGIGKHITIPEMNVSGFLVEVEKVDPDDIVPSTGIGYGVRVSPGATREVF